MPDLKDEIKIENIANYIWETRWILGSLVDYQLELDLLAYPIKSLDNLCGIRVLHNTSKFKPLLKTTSNYILDVSFSQIVLKEQITIANETKNIKSSKLAFLDANHHVFLYTISIIDLEHSFPNKIDNKCIPLCVLQPPFLHLEYKDISRIKWKNICRDINELTQLLIIILENQVYVVETTLYNPDPQKIVDYIIDENVNSISNSIKLETLFASNSQDTDISENIKNLNVLLNIKQDKAITDFDINNEGSLCLTSNFDGLFQICKINLELHLYEKIFSFYPHGMTPLSGINFIESAFKNVKQHLNDQISLNFVTFSNCNSELKLWNCTSICEDLKLECNQAISLPHFSSNDTQTPMNFLMNDDEVLNNNTNTKQSFGKYRIVEESPFSSKEGEEFKPRRLYLLLSRNDIQSIHFIQLTHIDKSWLMTDMKIVDVNQPILSFAVKNVIEPHPTATDIGGVGLLENKSNVTTDKMAPTTTPRFDIFGLFSKPKEPPLLQQALSSLLPQTTLSSPISKNPTTGSFMTIFNLVTLHPKRLQNLQVSVDMLLLNDDITSLVENNIHYLRARQTADALNIQVCFTSSDSSIALTRTRTDSISVTSKDYRTPDDFYLVSPLMSCSTAVTVSDPSGHSSSKHQPATFGTGTGAIKKITTTLPSSGPLRQSLTLDSLFAKKNEIFHRQQDEHKPSNQLPKTVDDLLDKPNPVEEHQNTTQLPPYIGIEKKLNPLPLLSILPTPPTSTNITSAFEPTKRSTNTISIKNLIVPDGIGNDEAEVRKAVSPNTFLKSAMNLDPSRNKSFTAEDGPYGKSNYHNRHQQQRHANHNHIMTKDDQQLRNPAPPPVAHPANPHTTNTTTTESSNPITLLFLKRPMGLGVGATGKGCGGGGGDNAVSSKHHPQSHSNNLKNQSSLVDGSNKQPSMTTTFPKCKMTTVGLEEVPKKSRGNGDTLEHVILMQKQMSDKMDKILDQIDSLAKRQGKIELKLGTLNTPPTTTLNKGFPSYQQPPPNQLNNSPTHVSNNNLIQDFSKGFEMALGKPHFWNGFNQKLEKTLQYSFSNQVIPEICKSFNHLENKFSQAMIESQNVQKDTLSHSLNTVLVHLKTQLNAQIPFNDYTSANKAALNTMMLNVEASLKRLEHNIQKCIEQSVINQHHNNTLLVNNNHSTMNESFKMVFKQELLPKIETMLNEIFNQVELTFEGGMKQFCSTLDQTTKDFGSRCEKFSLNNFALSTTRNVNKRGRHHGHGDEMFYNNEEDEDSYDSTTGASPVRAQYLASPRARNVKQPSSDATNAESTINQMKRRLSAVYSTLNKELTHLHKSSSCHQDANQSTAGGGTDEFLNDQFSRTILQYTMDNVTKEIRDIIDLHIPNKTTTVMVTPSSFLNNSSSRGGPPRSKSNLVKDLFATPNATYKENRNGEVNDLLATDLVDAKEMHVMARRQQRFNSSENERGRVMDPEQMDNLYPTLLIDMAEMLKSALYRLVIKIHEMMDKEFTLTRTQLTEQFKADINYSCQTLSNKVDQKVFEIKQILVCNEHFAPTTINTMNNVTCPEDRRVNVPCLPTVNDLMKKFEAGLVEQAFKDALYYFNVTSNSDTNQQDGSVNSLLLQLCRNVDPIELFEEENLIQISKNTVLGILEKLGEEMASIKTTEVLSTNLDTFISYFDEGLMALDEKKDNTNEGDSQLNRSLSCLSQDIKKTLERNVLQSSQAKKLKKINMIIDRLLLL